MFVDEFVESMDGERATHSILVANNGLAAVKFMRSVRSWAAQAMGSGQAVTLVAMATPNDIRINAEHLQLADQFIEVPAGGNVNNYANVALIVQVGSTILAQSAGVPTLPWSGSAVHLPFHECENGDIPREIYSQACLTGVEDSVESCRSIGFPVMLKASWGGGGKGIRMVSNEEDVRTLFKQVQGEVPGSPVFAMKLAPTSRHLEVQLLCDRYGNVASLKSRDCSVQRRHQKIIEEGPVTVASQEKLLAMERCARAFARRVDYVASLFSGYSEELLAMERCARALARSVKYVGAATVEHPVTEGITGVNIPAAQVEHPVTEGITGVNIPAAQVMIAMGVPLWRIPDIRSLYGQDPKGSAFFDVETAPQQEPLSPVVAEPLCHVVAVRITAEDAYDGFKPTCGRIDEIHFRSTPEVWGYFSVKSGGGIHEYSDSQFGHLFAKGSNRESCIRSLVVALRDLTIRGEIRTSVDYLIDMIQICTSVDYLIDMTQIRTSVDDLIDMIQSVDMLQNKIHTRWLDNRIASAVSRTGRVPWHLAVIAGAVVRMFEQASSLSAESIGFLKRGQLAPADVSPTSSNQTNDSLSAESIGFLKRGQLPPADTDLVIGGHKYTVQVARQSPQACAVTLNGTTVEVHARKMEDGGYLMQVDGRAHAVHVEEEAQGTRLFIDTLTCLLSKDIDPSRLTASSPGKLV
eukprot:gene11177-18790_t